MKTVWPKGIPVRKIPMISKTTRPSFKAHLIKIWTRRVRGLEKEQDRLFRLACRQLRVDKDSREGTILFETLFNNTSSAAQTVKAIWPNKPKG